MKKHEFGDRITVRNRLKRRKGATQNCWVTIDTEPVEVIFLGYRTLSNGNVYHSWEEGASYAPTSHLRAMLVCASDRKNPFYAKEIEQ
jgi:hypothetical protein